MKKRNQSILITLLLAVVSSGVNILQIVIFKKPQDTGFYFLQDLAFLPLQSAIVTVILAKLLNVWSKRERLRKNNMAISAFFSEVGTSVIIKLTDLIENCQELRAMLGISSVWTGTDFSKAKRFLKNIDIAVVSQPSDFEELKTLLIEKRTFILRMLENPNLLEHDTFAEMLLALFHFAEELLAREDFDNLPATDIEHLAGDITRVLKALLIQWVHHMEHLQTAYPYLYSLEVRRNPFAEDAGSVVV